MESRGSKNVAPRFVVALQQLIACTSNISETAYVDQILQRSVLAVRDVLVRLVRHLACLSQYVDQRRKVPYEPL
jgi:hypothetical protein